jgi:hypothetical protein
LWGISGSGAVIFSGEPLQVLIEGARIIENSRKGRLRAGSSFGTFWMLKLTRHSEGRENEMAGLGQMAPVSQRFFWDQLENRLQSAAEDR